LGNDWLGLDDWFLAGDFVCVGFSELCDICVSPDISSRLRSALDFDLLADPDYRTVGDIEGGEAL